MPVCQRLCYSLRLDSKFSVDAKQDVVDSINHRPSPINEPSLNEIVKRNVETGRLKGVPNSRAHDQLDIDITSVQAPITSDRIPDLSYLDMAVSGTGEKLMVDKIYKQLIMLRLYDFHSSDPSLWSQFAIVHRS